MSTRSRKTRQRKLARIEDQDAMIRLIQRLDEAGDPKDWKPLDLAEMRRKYAEEEYLSACEKAWKKHGNGEELHCCSRCHEDYGDGYDFIDIELSDGTMIDGCCEVYNKLKSLNKTKEDDGWRQVT